MKVTANAMEASKTKTIEKADLRSTLLFLFRRMMSIGSSWTV